MADSLRNEVKIEIAGEERTMRANFSAIRGIEAALGKSVVSIVTDISNGDISITSAATIIYHGLRGFDDKRLTLEQVGDAVIEAGISNVSLAVIEFISKALNGVSVGKPEETAAA